MSMSVPMELTPAIRSVQTVSEAILAHVTLAIDWHLTDKRVMVSPLSVPCMHIMCDRITMGTKSNLHILYFLSIFGGIGYADGD